MTAELADCYATKRDGVASIVAAVRQAVGRVPTKFWQTNGELIGWSAAETPRTVAAANWQALATWGGRLAPKGGALLIDIGSTTTDVISLQEGIPMARGATDVERLLHHELVYTGMRRTPLCAVSPVVSLRGVQCSAAAELFATTLDAYLLLGWIPPDETDRQTADGRPATIEFAHDRIARMVCCDRDEISTDEARDLAQSFYQAQSRQITAAVDAVVGRQDIPVETVILSGSGEMLADRVISTHPQLQSARRVRISQVLSQPLADAACAYAIAVLAEERRC